MTTVDHFEAQYRADPDPWGYRTSDYERSKYQVTLAACGPGPFADALELGGSIGVFSAQLAPRCRQLTTIDYSPTAVAEARRALTPYPHARAVAGAIPEDLPAGPWDLVVASEILYYLSAADLARTCEVLRDGLAATGRLVCVHWRPAGPERPLTADQVHAALRQERWLRTVRSQRHESYLLDVLERA